MAERVQKLLAEAGVGSRRQVETMIEGGRVSVNGTVCKLGDKAELTDTLRVDGWIIKLNTRPENKHRVLAYYKPEGEVCTRADPEGRKTIFDRLPRLKGGRWISVGRLDINTNGLILLTTDGELANRLMHPSMEVEREYAVRVRGEASLDTLNTLKSGVELEDGMGRFDLIRDVGGQGQNHWYHVILKQGRNREVRRLWESQGMMVSRLTRVRYGAVVLRRGLKPGEWDELGPAEVNALRKSAGIAPMGRPASSDNSATTTASRKKRPMRGKAVRSRQRRNP